MALNQNDNTLVFDTVISNVSTNLIRITEDKLRNVLNDNIGKLRKPNDIIAAVALFLSLLGVLMTSDFHDKFGIKVDTWNGFFMFLCFASFCYFCYVCRNLLKNRCSIEDIMQEIKNAKKQKKKSNRVEHFFSLFKR